MSFPKILARKGETVTLISVTNGLEDGYLTKSEAESEVNAFVQPLSAQELRFWTDVGIESASLVCFFEQASTAKLGDRVEVDGTQYLISAFDTHSFATIPGYKRAILSKVG